MTSQAKAEKIISEKKKRGIVILAHTYQMPEIIDVADITGDSFKLSQAADFPLKSGDNPLFQTGYVRL